MSGIAESHLSNKDLAPTGVEQRTWGTYHLAALWVGLSIVITTYTLASGLIAAGMTWWQGLLTVSLGNFLVLIPILLNSHPGTKYGIPFPVLVRSSFGENLDQRRRLDEVLVDLRAMCAGASRRHD